MICADHRECAEEEVNRAAGPPTLFLGHRLLQVAEVLTPYYAIDL